MIEFSHNNFLHAQVERSFQFVMGLEPIDLLQPSSQPSLTGSCLESETRNETEQPVNRTHQLLSHVGFRIPFYLLFCIYRLITLIEFFLNCFGNLADGGYVYSEPYNGGLEAKRGTRVRNL